MISPNEATKDIIELHVLEQLRIAKEENELLKSWMGSGEIRCCCVCGAPIKNLSAQRAIRPFVWCTRKCFKWKPQKIIKLERDFGGMDILDILKETSRKFGSLKSQHQALDLSVPHFIHVVRKYSGLNYFEFMYKYSSGFRKKEYLRKLNDSRKKKGESDKE